MELLGGLIVCLFIKNKPCWSVVGLCLLLVGCQQKNKEEKETLPFYNTPVFNAEWIDEQDPAYSKIHTIDSFSLTNQVGQVITNDSLAGHIYVANFFFTSCPSICPKMTGNLKKLQDTFATNRQLKLVSFSVMPWVDSVPKLRKYGYEHGVDPARWYLLTGEKERIYNLGRRSYFAEKGLGIQKDSTSFLHTESMLLVDKKGRIRGIYNATQPVDIERVTDDIRVLLAER